MTSLGISVEHYHLWRTPLPKLMITELETDLRQIKMNTNLKFLCLKGQEKVSTSI